MGMFLREDDSYVPALLEMLNLHFASLETDITEVRPEGEFAGLGLHGILEIQAIHNDIGLFKPGRPLVNSLRALGVGGQWNARIKKRWYALLYWLETVDSNVPGLKGGPAIVKALANHLGPTIINPYPVYFQGHDSRDEAQGGIKVMIYDPARPLRYIDTSYLVISIPMQPWKASACSPAAAPSVTP